MYDVCIYLFIYVCVYIWIFVQCISFIYCISYVIDIEAQIREIQSKKKELLNTASEKEQVALGKTGFYDQDIYDDNKFDGYVTSIATNDEIEVLLIRTLQYIFTVFIIFKKSIY